MIQSCKLLVVGVLGFITLGFSPTIEMHYRDVSGDKARAPGWLLTPPLSSYTIWICHGSGCTFRTKFRFKKHHLQQLRNTLKSATDPVSERKRLKVAIAYLEVTVGKFTGTGSDKPQASWATSGWRSQMECVDESLNTTSYLLAMERAGILKYHRVDLPIVRGGIMPHWAASIREKETQKEFVVDSYWGANGDQPLIQPSAVWFGN